MNHDIELRTPTPDDAAAMWQLVRDDGTLDVNSPYAYLLVCTDYADTSLVATDGRGVVGFVSGYRPPSQPDDLFVWQIGVHRRARRRGLGRRLLKALLDCPGSEGATSLTATVTPDNEASMALFERFAANLGVPCERSERFAADLFPAGDHSAEFELRIHPLPPADRREIHEEPIVMKTARPDAIARLESDVRSYGRMWPATFETARGSTIWDTDGNPYIDLFAGAGSLNYGHNDPQMRDAVVEYLTGDGIVHSLDVATVARRRFLERFEEVILEPHGFDWKVQFPGPTGTNAVEAAMKLARKYTGREHVVGFTNAFHGMTLGSLSVSGNSMKREGAGVGLGSTTNVPYDGYFGDQVDTMSYLDALLADDGSGFEKPAAVIVETVQAEGGLATASPGWLRRLREVCTDHGVLLIVDDIQAGCGRTGPFFSFDVADIEPDIVTLSKSLSGFGMPFAVTLMRHDLDVWEPG
ncbi:MAG: diaminobutyrate acetyltransferase, partial [Nitriliruptoraceae bacterium]